MDEMNNQIIIDSNIVIYSAEPGFPSLRRWLKNKQIILSIVSKIEVLGFSNISRREENYFTEFFSKTLFLNIDEVKIETAINLRQQKKMSLGDAIIAATALSEGLPLLTANIKDFKHIKGLKLIDLNEIKA